MRLLAFVMAAMPLLAPRRDHHVLALAISDAVESERALCAGEDGKLRTAALMVAVSYRESGFDIGAVGDGGHSFGAFQNHDSSGGTKALLGDADAQARKALAMLRISLRSCPEHPIAWYAGGPRGCASPHAQRVSADRVAVAKRVFAEVPR